MLFHGSFILGGFILHGAKDEGSFEAYTSYLRDAFDGETKVIQLAEAKLGLESLSTVQEDAEVGTLEEYATVLLFECMIRATGELDCFSAHIRLREPSKSEDKADQKEGGHGGVPQCRRGGSTDREERDADAKSRIVGQWAWQSAMVPQRRDFHGVIDPLLEWMESISCERGRGGEEWRGKLQVPGQGKKAEKKKLHKTGINGILIKIAESGELRVNARVLDQGMK
ncbi:hypothetical protein B296_00017838 [Ensete ventricosum]|uniref:Uncharacterized protein n=1 Tax=Ensete ventricosum TaxID=4639 RepID=A0A427B4G2_ENSVE|nr:hypothetical protein B296_00017838 [Ensete ventricosum]